MWEYTSTLKIKVLWRSQPLTVGLAHQLWSQRSLPPLCSVFNTGNCFAGKGGCPQNIAFFSSVGPMGSSWLQLLDSKFLFWVCCLDFCPVSEHGQSFGVASMPFPFSWVQLHFTLFYLISFLLGVVVISKCLDLGNSSRMGCVLSTMVTHISEP